MIGFVTVGTNDLARATAFYDKLFSDVCCGQRAFTTPRMVIWGFGPVGSGFGVSVPFDGQPASIGNGVMVSIAASSKAEVDKFHANAIALGARDEGTPGPREGNFYAGFFRDLDGNKLCVYFMP
jgi:predicted lactoylglutathione lyase